MYKIQRDKEILGEDDEKSDNDGEQVWDDLKEDDEDKDPEMSGEY
jgi:hypothetical protein